MKILPILLVLTLCDGYYSKSLKSLDLDNSRFTVELIQNGSTYKITSMADGLSITALPTGTVITDEYLGHEEQKWTLFEHPKDDRTLEFVNYAVPYNDLSGYEDPPENPGVYPRRLTLNKHRIMPDEGIKGHAKNDPSDEDHLPVPWQILIRNRWCLQNNGQYRQLDIDDCEIDPALYQFWRLELVQLGGSQEDV